MSLGTCKFVSKKVSCVRWQPRPDTANTDSNCVATGSWDDEENCVSLYRCEPSGSPSGSVSLVCSVSVPGDVTGLSWLDSTSLVVSDSSGSLQLYRLSDRERLSLAGSWVSHPRGCTSLSTSLGSLVAVGGAEGSLSVTPLPSHSPRSYSVPGDTCSIRALAFTKAQELVSANLRGQLRLWDLRLPPGEACTLSLPPGSPTSCLATHPAQPHVLVAGGEDGVMAIWDLRSPGHPATLLSAHGSCVGDIKFHPNLPDSLFTCSQGGDVCHWRTGGSGAGYGDTVQDILADSIATATTSPWLNSEAVKHKVETHSLVTKQPLPVNSLDVLGTSVVFGGDNEAFYVLNNVLF